MNTIEGAMVITAITAVAGTSVAGFVTMAQSEAVHALARDVARAEALGEDGRALAGRVAPEATVDIRRSAETGLPTITVSVSSPGALLDVHAEASVVAEPDGADAP